MNCPLGHGELHTEIHTGIEVDACAVCGGEWLDPDELQAMESATVRDSVVLSGMIEYQPNPGQRPCVVCHKPMYEFDYRGNPLQVDVCPDGHGYWLDGGEEERVRVLIRQRARDLNRAASAEGSFGAFLSRIRGQLGGRRR
ncbi:MAG: zf-TFIIB domain-containing protein [Chloroflexi bacterium]|nr:zf-TFIIB domain-containing protein [Chloroflexota bacterium]